MGISQTKRNLAGLACAGLLSSLTWAQVATDISKEIAPSGTLRAVINLGNPILARKDNINGEPIGLSVDLAKELAKKFHLPLKLLAVDSAAAAVEAVIVGDADLGFFAIDPVRGKGITFTPPYLLIEGSYLVKNDSPLLNTSQVDQAQHRVVVGKGSAYDLFLTRELKAAQLVRAPSSPMVTSLFIDGRYEVAAGVKQQLESDAQRFGGLRLLPGRFMVIEQAMGQPNGLTKAANEALTQFIMEMKSNGFVRESLLRHHILGASIAP